MHENRNLFLFLIKINNMHRTRHVSNTQDLYSAPVWTVRCFVTPVFEILGPKRIEVTTLNFQGHVTSSVTIPHMPFPIASSDSVSFTV